MELQSKGKKIFDKTLLFNRQGFESITDNSGYCDFSVRSNIAYCVLEMHSHGLRLDYNAIHSAQCSNGQKGLFPHVRLTKYELSIYM